jgi:hypothetical protein
MPKFNRLGRAPDPIPMKSLGVRLDEQTRAMLRAIMDYEDRTTESDMIRVLIRRGYRALPPEAKIADTTTPRDGPEQAEL